MQFRILTIVIALAVMTLAPAQALLAGSTDTILLMPVADTFSRANLPNATYGDAGALHVSGAAAQNAMGEVQGEADSWLRFDTTDAIQQFDLEFGAGNWTLESAVLSLREDNQPNSTVFTRGPGSFAISWIANDDWTEGPGTSNSPQMAAGNQIGWAHGQSLLTASDRALGTFQNDFTMLRQEFALDLDGNFLADVLSPGADLTLRLSAASDDIGFTFNASTMAANAPQLILTAVPEPATALLIPIFFGMQMIRLRRIP